MFQCFGSPGFILNESVTALMKRAAYPSITSIIGKDNERHCTGQIKFLKNESKSLITFSSGSQSHVTHARS